MDNKNTFRDYNNSQTNMNGSGSSNGNDAQASGSASSSTSTLNFQGDSGKKWLAKEKPKSSQSFFKSTTYNLAPDLSTDEDDSCVYTYKGHPPADLPSSFFADSFDNGTGTSTKRQKKRNRGNGEEGGNNHGNEDADERHQQPGDMFSPEMDFLEMDFDPGANDSGDSSTESDSLPDSELDMLARAEVHTIAYKQYDMKDKESVSEAKKHFLFLRENYELPTEQPCSSRSVRLEPVKPIDKLEANLAPRRCAYMQEYVREHLVILDSAEAQLEAEANLVSESNAEKLFMEYKAQLKLVPRVTTSMDSISLSAKSSKSSSPSSVPASSSLTLANPVIGFKEPPTVKHGFRDMQILDYNIAFGYERECLYCDFDVVSIVLTILQVENSANHNTECLEYIYDKVDVFLQEKWKSGTTTDEFIAIVSRASNGLVYGRFFRPPENLQSDTLIQWLYYWMDKGAVPVVTRCVQSNNDFGEDESRNGWVREVVVGLLPNDTDHKLVDRPPICIMKPSGSGELDEMISGMAVPSVIRVCRKQVVDRLSPDTDLSVLSKFGDPSWNELNVLGQVANMVLEERPGSSIGRRVRSSFITIPSKHEGGVTLFLRTDSPSFKLLQNCNLI